MKVKRVKRAARILSVFRYSFGLQPPFRVLPDGTFALAALRDKINLREQLPKYLSAEVELVTTRCVLAELEKLGSPVYGALHICKQYEVDPCPHNPPRPACDCLTHLARRAKNGKTKYIIGTQDPALTKRLREVAGTPVLFIKYNSILLDRVSEQTKAEMAANTIGKMEKVRELKKEILGEEERKIRKKKIKGQNPLSCKKKLKRASQPRGEKTATGKRRRKKKKTSEEEGHGCGRGDGPVF